MGIPGCGVPGPDPVAFNLINTIGSFCRSPSRLPCPPNYKLLSCGIKDIKKNRGTSCDSRRCTITVSNSECKCSDRNGAKCVSRCSIGDMNFTITKSSQFHGIANVSCPSAYKDRKLCCHHYIVKCCTPHHRYFLSDCSMQCCENNSKCSILGYGLQYHNR